MLLPHWKLLFVCIICYWWKHYTDVSSACLVKTIIWADRELTCDPIQNFRFDVSKNFLPRYICPFNYGIHQYSLPCMHLWHACVMCSEKKNAFVNVVCQMSPILFRYVCVKVDISGWIWCWSHRSFINYQCKLHPADQTHIMIFVKSYLKNERLLDFITHIYIYGMCVSVQQITDTILLVESVYIAWGVFISP